MGGIKFGKGIMAINVAKRSRRGFNLIEAAIVLGVVGLVIGGIWIAASSVRQRMAINDIEVGITRGLDYYRQNPLIRPAASGIPEYAGISSMVAQNTPTIGIMSYSSGLDAFIGGGVGLNMAAMTAATSDAICPSCNMFVVGLGFTNDDMSAYIAQPEKCAALINLFLQDSGDLQAGASYGLQIVDTSGNSLGNWDPGDGSAKPSFSTYGTWCKTTGMIQAYYAR